MTGTGLGLFGVRTRAEGLQGTCGARHNTESSTGTGTVLWFALPYVPGSDVGSTMLSSSSSPKQTHHLAVHAFEALQKQGHVFQRSQSRSIASPIITPRVQPQVKEADCESSLSAKPDAATFSLHSSTNSINQPSAEVLIRALKLTAMVVEDTPTVRKLMQKLLLSMGFESVVCYENGSKGLEAMMAGPVDIVFSDVQMPIMTGPEVRFL